MIRYFNIIKIKTKIENRKIWKTNNDGMKTIKTN